MLCWWLKYVKIVQFFFFDLSVHYGFFSLSLSPEQKLYDILLCYEEMYWIKTVKFKFIHLIGLALSYEKAGTT